MVRPDGYFFCWVTVTSCEGLSLCSFMVLVCFFSFEWIGMVLPLESEMKDKDKLGKVSVLITTFLLVMCRGIGNVGLLCFLFSEFFFCIASYGEPG